MPQLGKPVAAWTFGDQVPGPVIRARVGDRIKFSMTNRSDEVAPGMQIIAPSMMHSMDFHAAMVSPRGAAGKLLALHRPPGFVRDLLHPKRVNNPSSCGCRD